MFLPPVPSGTTSCFIWIVVFAVLISPFGSSQIAAGNNMAANTNWNQAFTQYQHQQRPLLLLLLSCENRANKLFKKPSWMSWSMHRYKARIQGQRQRKTIKKTIRGSITTHFCLPSPRGLPMNHPVTPDWDWTQPPRSTEVSLRTDDQGWRRFTGLLLKRV